MPENTKIEWVDHSASPWHGCAEVHEGCDNCYARTQAKRNPKTLGVWGPDGTRVMSASFAKNCRRWNKSAKERGVVETVFPSICDPFEDWHGPIMNAKGERLYRKRELNGMPYGESFPRDLVTIDDLRRELFELIDNCQSLRFLLLTKRPENVRRMWPAIVRPSENWFFDPEDQKRRGLDNAGPHKSTVTIKNGTRNNVWIMTSVSNQATFDAMYSHLLGCQDLCSVLGLSAEPLLGPIDASAFLFEQTMAMPKRWVIVGGESGNSSRACNIDWIRQIRDQCKEADVACFVKQLGANVEWSGVQGGYMDGVPNVWPMMGVDDALPGRFRRHLHDKKGGDWSEWPEDLRVREYPTISR